MDKISLTEKQRDIYNFVLDHFRRTGVTPVYKDIADHFNVSKANIAKHLMAIERRGWIRRSNGMKNGLVILEE